MMTSSNDQQLMFVLLILVCWLVYKYRPNWRWTGTAHGTARWASEADLNRAGMFSGRGLILGRTPRRGKLIRIPRYVHAAVYAPTGAGKCVSFVIPTLLDYTKGSVFVFDPKGELYKITDAARRAMGQRIIVIDPFHVVTRSGESDCFNPFSAIPLGPTLVDEARALAEALIVRAPEGDRDPFWNNSASLLLTMVFAATLILMKYELKNLALPEK